MLNTQSHRPRLIVGISGASGAVYGVRLLELLRSLAIETHLIVSKSAMITLIQETDRSTAEVQSLASHVHQVGNVGAAIASGSFRTMGMIIAPCSVKTMSEIASGVTGNLMSRAADVVLKERRRLVLMLRETPLHLGHIRTMLRVTEMGAIVCPPVPALYNRPASVDAIIDYSLARVLDLFALDTSIQGRWEGNRAHRVETESCLDDSGIGVFRSSRARSSF